MFRLLQRLSSSSAWLVHSIRGGDTYTQSRMGKALLKKAERKQLIELGEQARRKGLVQANLGVLSFHLPPERLAISMAGADLGALDDKTLLVVNQSLERTAPENAPPQLDWHRAVYHNSSANFCLLFQPVYALLANQHGLTIQPQRAPQAAALLGGIAQLPTDSTPAQIGAAVAGNSVIVMGEVGALVWAEQPSDLLHRAELLEYVARLSLAAHEHGLPPINSRPADNKTE